VRCQARDRGYGDTVDGELEHRKCFSVSPIDHSISSPPGFDLPTHRLTLLLGAKVEYIPVAIILEPGTTNPVKYLSACRTICLGSSPTGTISGASWSLMVC
jgi:hypothetical protein